MNALKTGGAVILALGALVMLAISTTADLGRTNDEVRLDVQTVASDVVEWMPNTLQVAQDRVTGQVRMIEAAEYVMVRAKLMNPSGEFCESSFDQIIDAQPGETWTFEILSSNCTIDGVLLYAKSF
jgi:hypothetical protein